MSLTTAYRPDIDGLRGVAVAGVLAFHFWPNAAPGGFTGVDVFFVISGYLIAGLLFKQLEFGKIDFAEFYRRRIRRLFPALAVVLAASLLIGVLASAPDELESLAAHVAAGALFVSNMLSAREGGYFDAPAIAKPMLHLWSLAIEEQFYLLFPPLVALFGRLRRGLLPSILFGLTALSLGAWLAFGQSLQSAYYLLPFRAWELLLGALLTFASVKRLRPGLAEAGTGLGLVAIVLVYVLGKAPGLTNVFAAFGAALVIWCAPASRIMSSPLNNRASIGLGLISYPFYLWHWPLLSFAVVHAGSVGNSVRVVIAGAALLLATLTYRLVEIPIRAAEGWAWPVRLVVLMAGIVALSAGIYVSGGLPNRLAAAYGEDIGSAPFLSYLDSKFSPCENETIRAEIVKDSPHLCMQSQPGAPRLALLGDSHGQSLFPGLAEAAPDRNPALYARAGYQSRGFPVLGSPTFDVIVKEVARTSSIEVVVLAAYWSQLLGVISRDKAVEDLEKTVMFLRAAGKRVILMEDIPDFRGHSVRNCKYKINFIRDECEMSRAKLMSQTAAYYDVMETVAKKAGAEWIRIADTYCSGDVCRMTSANALMYRDTHHLNVVGSRALGLIIRNAMRL